MRWTKGRHAFIVTTHTDKQHIHSHIYYNSTTLDCTRKFRNYGEWQAEQKKPLTYQDRLRAAIDTALAKKPADFPAFLSLMEQAGYEVKQRRGVISFRAPGQKQITRLRSDTLGEGHSEADIRTALSGARQRPVSFAQKSFWLSTFNPGSKEKTPAMSDGLRCSISNKWPLPLLFCRTTA